MRLIPVQMQVRSLMVGVALAALVCWLGARRQRFQRLAADHESRVFGPAPRSCLLDPEFQRLAAAHKSRGPIVFVMNGSLTRGMAGPDRFGRTVTDSESDWHRLMAQRYRRAARRPWLPLPPARSLEQYCKMYKRWRYDRQHLMEHLREKWFRFAPPGLDPQPQDDSPLEIHDAAGGVATP
jgi:hypothetical protein